MSKLNQKSPSSELILNSDGSIYHLNLLPEDIGQTVILVGDPDRVPMVSSGFDSILLKKQKREFVTHTGMIGNNKITVLSTGIGTDNIDIVMNELDALANLDLTTGETNKDLRSLSLIRIGTSGSLQADIGVDEVLVSSHGLGLDTLMSHYRVHYNEAETTMASAINSQLHISYLRPYVVQANAHLLNQFSAFKSGITATCAGFYAPQGRQLRAPGNEPDLISKLSAIQLPGNRITNFEMETAAIYGLARVLGHKALSVNAVMANRINGTFSSNPHQTMEKTISRVLEIIRNL